MILTDRLKESKFQNEAVEKIITAFIESMEVLTEKKVGHLLKGVALELARSFPEDQKVIYLLFAAEKKVRKKGHQSVTLKATKRPEEGIEIVVDQGCVDCGDDVLTIKTQSNNKKNVLIVPAASKLGTLPIAAHGGDGDGQHALMNQLVKLDKQGNVVSTTKATAMKPLIVKSPSQLASMIGKNLGVTTAEAYAAAMEAAKDGLEIDPDNMEVSKALIKEYTKKAKAKKKPSYNMWNDAKQWTDVVEVVGADSEKLWDFIVENVNEYNLDDNETKLPVLAKVILGEIELRRRGKKS